MQILRTRIYPRKKKFKKNLPNAQTCSLFSVAPLNYLLFAFNTNGHMRNDDEEDGGEKEGYRTCLSYECPNRLAVIFCLISIVCVMCVRCVCVCVPMPQLCIAYARDRHSLMQRNHHL